MSDEKSGEWNPITLDVGTFRRWGLRGTNTVESERGRKDFGGLPGGHRTAKCRLARSLPNAIADIFERPPAPRSTEPWPPVNHEHEAAIDALVNARIARPRSTEEGTPRDPNLRCNRGYAHRQSACSVDVCGYEPAEPGRSTEEGTPDADAPARYDCLCCRECSFEWPCVGACTSGICDQMRCRCNDDAPGSEDDDHESDFDDPAVAVQRAAEPPADTCNAAAQRAARKPGET